MKRLLASLSLRHRIAVALVALIAGAAIWGLVQWRRESDFRPLFTGLTPEDAGAIVQKLKESGVEYRVPEGGGAVLAPSAKLAELRLNMASAGLPKTGRIGFELFDKTNLGATEFTEHVNYRRALEGELERSMMALAEIEQARVHLTFPKDSVFLEAQQPAKASVLLRLRPGAHLSPQNVLAVNHLVASAVEGLSPDAVSVLDMNGNLLSRPRASGGLDGPEPSEAVLDYRHKVEADVLAKVNSTLEPLLGANRFHAGVSVECDFSGSEQSEELFDPARSVMVSSQRTEDNAGASSSAAGVPGTASTLPRPTSRPGSGSNRVSRVTENVTYQSSRTVKKTRLPAGGVKKISLAVMVDQAVTWERDNGAFRRVLVPPTPEKLKVIRDLLAGVIGLNTERGDQLTVETLPFETTLLTEPPAQPAAPAAPSPAPRAPVWWPQWIPVKMDPKTLMIAGGAVLAAIVLMVAFAVLRRKKRSKAQASVPAELPPGQAGAQTALTASAAAAQAAVESDLESQLAERDALQQRADAQALHAIKLAPVITKTAEVLARHLREKIKNDPVISANILRSWIRDEDVN